FIVLDLRLTKKIGCLGEIAFFYEKKILILNTSLRKIPPHGVRLKPYLKRLLKSFCRCKLKAMMFSAIHTSIKPLFAKSI
ncbi:hypothetical protein, partial [Bacteroides clarus]|uniref:hypothetical protein n=3 Tax=Bacteroides clarus TaxID=626929 RepID=UPI001E2A7BDE